METLHGGFYINSGTLNFEVVEENQADAESDTSNLEIPRKKKAVRNLSCSLNMKANFQYKLRFF